MNTRLPHQALVARIRSEGHAALESNQVAKRLAQLLPTRLKAIGAALADASRRRAADQRYALVSETYCHYIDELVKVRAAGRAARVEYETHLLLIEARRSMRRSQRC